MVTQLCSGIWSGTDPAHIRQTVFRPDGLEVAFVMDSGDVAFFDTRTGQRTEKCANPDIERVDVGREVTCLAYSADSKTFVTGMREGLLVQWSADRKEITKEQEAHNKEIGRAHV